MSDWVNVTCAICYAISAIAAVVMIIVTVLNYQNSIKINKSSAELERYFENVVMYAMRIAENTKKEIIEIIKRKQEKIKSGNITAKEIKEYNDCIQSLFLDYKRDVSSRLKIFDVKGKKIDQYWDKMDDNLANVIGQIDLKKLLTEESSVCDLFDKSVLFIKNVKFCKNSK